MSNTHRAKTSYGQTAGANRRGDLVSNVVQHAPDAIWVLEAASPDPAAWRILYANGAFERAYGVSGAQVVGRGALEFFRGRARAYDIEQVIEGVKRGLPFRVLHVRERAHETPVWLEGNYHPKVERDRVLWFAVSRDMTESILAQRHAKQLARALDEVHEAIAVSIAREDTWCFEYVNRALTQMLGYESQELIGRGWDPLFARASDAKRAEDLRAGLLTGQRVNGELLFRRKDGSTVSLAVSATPFHENGDQRRSYAVTVLRDVTDARREERLLREAAMRDSLTGLLNRREFERLLQNAVDMTPSGARAHVLMFLDLDGFKRINDTFGHDEGDRVLIAVGETVRRSLLPSDDVARWGGDEFAAILYFCATEQAAARAQALIQTLAAQPSCRGVGASIGIVRINADSKPAEAVRRADVLVYEAKAAGRNRVAADDAAS
ncbi:MAG TPA: sensor domain-containing diguanylate cyclase [Candidatus Baltobacteraceae bacterium]|nr:sensor domain-containing diguanylate cyclase [Candidatus Baltobacteraceae bacterium]